MSSPEITFLEKNNKRYLLQSTKGTKRARQKLLRARKRRDRGLYSVLSTLFNIIMILYAIVAPGIVSHFIVSTTDAYTVFLGGIVIIAILGGTFSFLDDRKTSKNKSKFNDVLEEELSILPHIYVGDSTIKDAVDALKVTGYYFDDESMTVKPSKRFAMNNDLANEFLDIVRTATGLKELESVNSRFVENRLQADWFDEKKKEYASFESLLNQKKEDFKNKLYAEYNLDMAAGRAFQNELIAK